MRRDDIEKAATQHANMIGWDHDPEETRGLFAYSFEKGAEWRINSVWHNAITDIPEAYFPVLVEDDLEDFEVSEKIAVPGKFLREYKQKKGYRYECAF